VNFTQGMTSQIIFKLGFWLKFEIRKENAKLYDIKQNIRKVLRMHVWFVNLCVINLNRININL